MRDVAPRATYRLQLHAGFGFARARGLVPYLARLGVSHLYLSPIARARAGSTHGYDVVDPTEISPELGGAEEFERLVEAAHEAGMGVLLDIVPNHMAASEQNPWWRDVLTYGRRSLFAAFFDIDWEAEGGRLVLPLLGRPYVDALAEVELSLVFEDGWAWAAYFDRRAPLRPESVAEVVAAAGPPRELAAVASAAASPSDPDTSRDAAERLRDALQDADGAVQQRIAEGATGYSGTALDRVLRDQHYRLTFWRTAPEHINYRRFFDINDLVALRAEREEVFEATHALVAKLVRAGAVDGLRVDHVDGLHDPRAYLERLAQIGGERRPYIVVEKILGDREELPAEWPVAGTTGYEFAGTVDRLFVDPAGLPAIEAWYRDLVPGAQGFPAIVRRAKGEVLEDLFPGEVERLTTMLHGLARGDLEAMDLPRSALRRVIVEMTVALPRYRTYITGSGVRDDDRRVLDETAQAVIATGKDPRAVAFFLRAVHDTARPEALAFAMRWQQLTGPVSAKGLEDSALFRDNRLLALNEVGRSPAEDLASMDVDAFHDLMQRRAERWPGSLNATSTHDTKRSEEVRYRMAAISELMPEWRRRFRRWRRVNARFRRQSDGHDVPLASTEAGFYQVLAGAWPVDSEPGAALVERMQRYAIKAARERGLRTSWLDTDDAYEETLSRWIGAILDARDNRAFVDDVAEFARKLAWFGSLNALSAVLLKVTTPGVPDFYQGSELPLLSLVDPDNRRPVDFQRRIDLLVGGGALAGGRRWWREALLDGRAKMALTQAALAVRREMPGLFTGGEYLPLPVRGERAANAIVFARVTAPERAIVVAPRLYASTCRAGQLPPRSAWGDTCIELPAGGPETWVQRIGKEHAIRARDGMLSLDEALSQAPVALLTPGR